MDKMSFLSLLLVSFPEAVLVTALGFLLIGLRLYWRDLLLIGLIQAAGACLIRLLPLPFGVHSIILIAYFTLNIFLITRLPYRVVLLASFLGLIFYGAIETISIPLMLQVTGYSMNDVWEENLLRVLFFLPQALIMALAIATCKILKVSLVDYLREYGDKKGRFSRKELLSVLQADIVNKQNVIILVIIQTPLLLLIILDIANNIAGSNGFAGGLSTFTSITGMLIVVFTMLSAVAVKKISHYAEIEYGAKRDAENLKQVEQLLQLSRKQRHDFHNQLQVIYGFIEIGSYDKAREYLRKIFNAAVKTADLIKTDNAAVSALLNTKVGVAEAQDIALEIIVDCNLKEIPLTSIEITSLLGNLIDNAIEAAGECIDTEKRVEIRIAVEYGAFTITCSNAGAGIAPAIREDIFKPDFTTKKGHSGLGLSIVQEIAAKYNGGVDVTSDESQTTFTVHIPSKKRGGQTEYQSIGGQSRSLSNPGTDAGSR